MAAPGSKVTDQVVRYYLPWSEALLLDMRGSQFGNKLLRTLRGSPLIEEAKRESPAMNVLVIRKAPHASWGDIERRFLWPVGFRTAHERRVSVRLRGIADERPITVPPDWASLRRWKSRY